VQGWFRRGMGGYVVMKELTSTAGVLRARPYFWQAAVSIAVILLTAFVAIAGTGNIAKQFGYESRGHQAHKHGRHRVQEPAAEENSYSPDNEEVPPEGEATETPQPQE
jgi:hypothetical protein